MKKITIITAISLILNIILLLAINPGLYVDDYGINLYSKMAEKAWEKGYDAGMQTATRDAFEAINEGETTSFIRNTEFAK